MANLIFRVMEKTDLESVVRIEQDCQSHPWSILQFQEGIKAGHQCWVAIKEFEGSEILVGFVIVSTVLDECSLLNISVRPAYQRQGIGRQLLEYVIERARSNDVVKIFLEVRAANASAIALYETSGFRQIAIRRDYYPAYTGREDGLVYSLLLSSDGSGGESS